MARLEAIRILLTYVCAHDIKLFQTDVKSTFLNGRITTLFTKTIGSVLFIYQIYVDDIIFGSTNPSFCEEFGDMMSREFEMSMIGELSFFLRL